MRTNFKTLIDTAAVSDDALLQCRQRSVEIKENFVILFLSEFLVDILRTSLKDVAVTVVVVVVAVVVDVAVVVVDVVVIVVVVGDVVV